jgi:hypothetical protein
MSSRTQREEQLAQTRAEGDPTKITEALCDLAVVAQQVGDLKLPRIWRTPEETMPLVCVRFRVLFRA